MDRRIKVVQEITPGLKDARLVLVLSQLVVDIVKTDGFGESSIFGMANAVPVHSFIRDAVLRGERITFFALVGLSGDIVAALHSGFPRRN